MTGAGVSVSAGIPDFRTPGTGLYDNLEEYGLPHAEAIFDLDFFRENPAPFYRLCKELWPGRYRPTPAHAFIRLLADKGKLRRCFTQNIDSLESTAGIPADRIVAAHGNFDSASTIPPDHAPVPIDEVKVAAEGGPEAWASLNAKHGGLIKPDIVFFGENLPRRFFKLSSADLPQCDLLLVLGTSLVVQPFASLVTQTAQGAPRVLINRERVGEGGWRGFDFDAPGTTDLHFQGDCDDGVRELARLAGWGAELDALITELCTPASRL
jgi:NAD-dependent deacetylase sirtuin 2